MKKARQKTLGCILAVGAVLLVLGAQQVSAGPLPGAIFTTLEDGSRVNANIYEAMEDVYLDGGPPQNAPSGAAGLPEGDYYFQVTDPSGKVLLSLDPVECRRFHVNADGVIDYVCPATCMDKIKGQMVEVDCTHATGIDIDHQELGAITVQLMPYKATPNKGGVYKVWATPVDMFVGDPELVDNDAYFHGFVPAWSKTDNYKVRRGKPFVPPVIKVKKFDDSDADGIWDTEEVEIAGWAVDVTDPLTVTNSYFTPAEIQAMPEGLWTVVEETPSDWLQTALYINAVAQPVTDTAQVEVLGLSGETHEVIFGNIQLGSISACKFYDRNANGVNDQEPAVAGILFKLDGVNVRGDEIHLDGHTGEDGCVTFPDLLPGDYTLTEVLPSADWMATTDTTVNVTLPEGAKLTYEFGNMCDGQADFDTKGYWHNKNGLGETEQDDFDYLNSLLPWQAPSSYFDAGDEPIDGLFADGTPVPEAKNVAGELMASEGTAWAEQSYFLVDRNATGDPREQLAQQLDAFIMNVRHRLDGDAAILLPGGQWAVASDVIAQAVEIWATGTASEQTAMGQLLDELNNSDMVSYIHYNPCPVIYP
jgi:hypothetical protein